MFSNKNIRSIKIYVLIHESKAFVGKTQGEIDPVYYRHRRAENPFTEKYFYPKNSKNPSIHILECISCSSREAYRHIVAWVRIFRDVGYEVINPMGTIDDANDLYPQTRELVYRLRPVSLDAFLKETQYKKQSRDASVSSAKPSERKQAKESINREKITLWATPEEKECFASYAKSLNLTQTQTLRYLMSKVHLEAADPLFPDWDNDTFMHLIQHSHAQEIEAKDKKIHNLQMALRTYIEKQSYHTKKLDECYTIARKSSAAFFSYFDSSAVLPLDIERGRYKDYVGVLPDDAKYAYPNCSGKSLLRLQAYLIGEGEAPARFILGIDCHGHRVMLRHYPGNAYFWGIHPGDERFSQRNSVWYMAWKKIGDVAELVAAYPMQIEAKYKNPIDEKEKLNKWVDEIVAESDALDKYLL